MIAMEIRSTTSNNDENIRWGYVKDRGNKFVSPTNPSKFESLGNKN